MRRSADRRLGLRLGLALVAVLAVGVPFGVLLLLVRAKWAPLLHLDQGVADGLHRLALRRPALVRALEVVSTVFDPNVFRVVGTGVAAWLLLDRRPRLAGWTLVTIWGGALLGVLVKVAVGRARPIFDIAVASAPGRSFPSGHALGSVVGCGVLLLVLLPLVRSGPGRRLCWAAAAAIVLAVGFARVGLGVHYVSDVVGGWVLGLGWLAATTAAFQAWRRELGGPATEPTVEGLEPEGREPDGREPEGREPEGLEPDGREPEGREPDGREPDGREPDGREPDGREPEGREPEGREPEGREPEGREPDGREPEGREPDGLAGRPGTGAGPTHAPRRSG